MFKPTPSKQAAIYIHYASPELMDVLRRTSDAWAEGPENICLSFEHAVQIPELQPYLVGWVETADVIVRM